MAAQNDPTPPNRNPSQFASTHWSLVLAAGDDRSASQRHSALSALCQSYWQPLYAYACRRAVDTHEAQDWTQAFFERLLEKNYVVEADPKRGKFRAFLITAFKHFLSKERDRAAAWKRGGRQSVIALDFESGNSHLANQSSNDLTAEQIYDRQWAITLLDQVLRRLEREQERIGRAAQFAFLKDSIIRGGAQLPYADIGDQLGISESAARMAASRLRGRYRELLRDEIAQTVATPGDIDDEIRHLFTALGK